MVHGLNALAIFRFTDSPNSTARRLNAECKTQNADGKIESPRSVQFSLRTLHFALERWASGVIERRHSMPGIEPGPLSLRPDGTPSLWWRINDQLRPIGI